MLFTGVSLSGVAVLLGFLSGVFIVFNKVNMHLVQKSETTLMFIHFSVKIAVKYKLIFEIKKKNRKIIKVSNTKYNLKSVSF